MNGIAAAAPRLAPGPRGTFLLGSLPAARKDALGLFLRSFRQHGDVVRFRFGPADGHLISSPEGVHHVLVENQRNYGKQTRSYENLRHVLGNGLLTAEGEFWRRQRRIAQPAFHRQRIASFADAMVRAAKDIAGDLERREGDTVDLSEAMSRLTLRVVGETLLGHDPTAHATEIGAALTWILQTTNERTTRLFQFRPSLPTPGNLRFRRALATLDRVVLALIEERRRNPGHRGDLLSMLMEARDEETGATMDDRQLRDEVMTTFLAGHETTANALAWTFLLLARFPAVRRELEAELATALAGRAPAGADVARLPYTRMVLDESMRLYPPAWLIVRSANAEDEIGGYRIPARSPVFVSPFIVHRHPRVWEDPEGFDPRRFSPERAHALPKGAYFPFGGGPRQCIGNGFALLEAQLVLATLAQRVRFELPPGEEVRPEASITLRPAGGLWMTVKRASGPASPS